MYPKVSVELGRSEQRTSMGLSYPTVVVLIHSSLPRHIFHTHSSTCFMPQMESTLYGQCSLYGKFFVSWPIPKILLTTSAFPNTLYHGAFLRCFTLIAVSYSPFFRTDLKESSVRLRRNFSIIPKRRFVDYPERPCDFLPTQRY